MLRVPFCCRQCFTSWWYRGRVVRFSADTQKGVAHVVEWCGSAGADKVFEPVLQEKAIEPPSVSALSAAPLGLVAGALPGAPAPPKSALEAEQVPFSSHQVYLCAVGKLPPQSDDETSLYPCYIACGCPLVVQVRLAKTCGALQKEVVRLYISESPKTIRTDQGVFDAYFHSLPEKAFARWQHYHVAHEEAPRQTKRAGLDADAEKYLDISSAEREVLTMIGLSLPSLIASDTNRHRSAARAVCCEGSKHEGIQSSVEDVDAIPM